MGELKVVSVPTTVEAIDAQEPVPETEVFEKFIFDRSGAVAVQTNVSYYFYATLFSRAAVDVVKLINGDKVELTGGIPGNRITPERPPTSFRVCVELDKLMEITTADQVTSDWKSIQSTMEHFMSEWHRRQSLGKCSR